jgi:signal transduction histidine kinase
MKSKFLTFFQLFWLRICFLFFFAFLFTLHPIQGQDRGVELKQAFIKAETDSLKIKAFESLFMHYIVRDLDETKSLLSTMDSLCGVIKIEDCKALEKLFRGYFHRLSGSYDSSLYFLNASYEAYEVLGNEGKMGVCLFNQGVVTSYKGDYDGAVDKYIQARDLYEKVGNINGSTNVSNSLGIIYKNIKDYDRSKESYKEGLISAKSTNNISMEAMINNNIANLFHAQAVYPDSVIYYASVALDLESEMDRNTGIASAHNLISAAYLDKNDRDKTIFHADKALEYSKLSKSKRFIVIHEIALADIYAKFNNYNTAIGHYKSSLALADSIGLLDYQVQGYQSYSELLAKMGDHRAAYQARLQYEEHQDSIDVEESKVAIADLEKKYETALKDQEIKDQQIKINKRTYQRNLLFGGLGLSILIGVLFIWGLVSRIRRNRKIAAQSLQIKEQKINHLEREKQLLILSSLLEGQETERIRIAKDLHDGLGGLLTSVKAHFGKIQSEIKKIKELDIYKTTTEMIDKAHDEVRRISHNLMPGDLRAGGLIIATEKLIDDLESIHGLKVVFEHIKMEGEVIEQEMELTLYRIIQELLNNIVKHANAKNVLVQISKHKGEIQLVVEDDGIGMSKDATKFEYGLGLKSIHSRVESFNGELDIHSKKDMGTTISINLPL